MTVKEFIEVLKELPQDATIGISEFWYLNNTGYDEITILDKSQIFINNGYMRKTDNGLALTRKGFLMSNSILAEIL